MDYIWPGTSAHTLKCVLDLTVLCLGKDYSNPRVLDFHTLNKPHEDMYDRGKVPRMPWYETF